MFCVQAHPELEGNDFYVTGESYAGHYVPAVAYKVFRASQSGEFTGLKLKGSEHVRGFQEELGSDSPDDLHRTRRGNEGFVSRRRASAS